MILERWATKRWRGCQLNAVGGGRGLTASSTVSCSTPWRTGPSALLGALSLECPPPTIWGHQRQLRVPSSSSCPVRSLERPLWRCNFTSERWQNRNHPMFAIQFGSSLCQHQVQAAQYTVCTEHMFLLLFYAQTTAYSQQTIEKSFLLLRLTTGTPLTQKVTSFWPFAFYLTIMMNALIFCLIVALDTFIRLFMVY